MTQQPEDQFSSFLEKYSEYLTDASNKEDLLLMGRRLFGAAGDTDQRPSMQLLKEKENELGDHQENHDTRRTFHTPRSLHSRLELPQNMTQEQITAEILALQEKNEGLRQQRRALEEKRNRMVNDYDNLIRESVEMKNKLNREMRKLKDELSQSLTRSRSDVPSDTAGIRVVMEELRDLNRKVLQKISGFREATRDALAHCERAALDRYKPRMEQLLNQIYENGQELPVEEILKRFEQSSVEIEDQITQLQNELTAENNRNERLQLDARQLEDRVSAQRDEVGRMKKQQAQLNHEIALLNDVAIQQIANLKNQYQKLLSDQENEDKATPNSSRAVVITTPKGKKSIKRTPSIKAQPPRELPNPKITSVEEFIELEKQSLLEKIHHSQMD